MVKRLAELHGGSVGVESELGQGSRFWVRLPLEGRASAPPRHARPTLARLETAPTLAPPSPRAEARPSDRPATAEGPTVLVVDDDPAALSLARRWLAPEGYVVVGAPSCDAAWARIVERPPDAILLDILFESGSGWELLARIRAEPSLAALPVVVVSIVADLGRGLALGALEVLQKPVDGEALVRVVESLGLSPGRAGALPRVLVVDDDPRAVDYVSRRLEQSGLSVTRAYGGRDALAAARQGGLAAVVLDLVMPDVSGFDVIRELRADDTTRELPIVVVTARALEHAEREALARSVHGVLGKDGWEENGFLEVIRAAIRAGLRRRLSGGKA
jgi:CheY-like chemotaxis protein